jgi:hypothetical protein
MRLNIFLDYFVAAFALKKILGKHVLSVGRHYPEILVSAKVRFRQW